MHVHRPVVWSGRLLQDFFFFLRRRGFLDPGRLCLSAGRENLGGHHPGGGARTGEQPITAQALGSAEQRRIGMQRRWSQVARVNLNALAERRAPARRVVGSPRCGELSAWGSPAGVDAEPARDLRNAGNVTGQGTWLWADAACSSRGAGAPRCRLLTQPGVGRP